jgi:hypothetical protein
MKGVGRGGAPVQRSLHPTTMLVGPVLAAAV